MPRPIASKPPVSAWLIRERKRVGMKPAEVAARLAAMGLSVQEGTVRTWEAGRSPSPENIEGLERIFESAAPGSAETRPEVAGLIAAIGDLVQEMRASRAQQTEATDALLSALAAVLPQGPVRSGTPDGSGSGARAGSGQ